MEYKVNRVLPTLGFGDGRAKLSVSAVTSVHELMMVELPLRAWPKVVPRRKSVTLNDPSYYCY